MYIIFFFSLREDIARVVERPEWKTYYISKLHFNGIFEEKEAIRQCIYVMVGARSELAGTLHFRT